VADEFLDRHYRRVIDEPIPAIGNVSPRAAIGTPEGRAKVIGWLKYLENGESRRARKGACTAGAEAGGQLAAQRAPALLRQAQ